MNAQLAVTHSWEDRLNLRREVLIAIIGIPMGAACIGLLIWHRAFVEPLWASPVSTLLILVGAVVAISGLWYFIFREPTRLWVALALMLHFPLVIAPAMVAESTETLVLNQRGVTELCWVVTAEQYVSSDRGGSETLVRHQVRCSDDTHEHITSPERRLDIGTRAEVVYDPEGMVGAQFEDPSDANLGRTVTIALGLLLLGIGIRVLYIWWRARRSRVRRSGRGR